jgi:phosphotransferase system enzyme I (PtsP)
MALIALGYRTLSVSAAAIGPVKAMVLGLDVAEAAGMIEALLQRHNGAVSIRERLQSFALQAGVPV